MELEEFLGTLGIKPVKRVLYDNAFTHRSFLNEGGKNRQSNERLEFLGDAVLSYLVSDYLYTTYPEQPEGRLTNLRSTIVKTETLAAIASKLNLGNYLYLSHGEEKSGGRQNPSLLADTFEALLGAVYIDLGITEAKEYLGRVLFGQIPDIIKTFLNTDYKSQLQEKVQLTSSNPPTYEVVRTEGPDHAKIFWVTVVIDGQKQEIGSGKSKQEAEQQAAAKTLEKIAKL